MPQVSPSKTAVPLGRVTMPVARPQVVEATLRIDPGKQAASGDLAEPTRQGRASEDDSRGGDPE